MVRKKSTENIPNVSKVAKKARIWRQQKGEKSDQLN
jgi:hypothetical protein